MSDCDIIASEIRQLIRIGYNDDRISQVITMYSGGRLSWQELSPNQQRRLAADLSHYGRIARKWHYALSGCLR
ncbi:MAG: hypothetical protein P4N41_22675 [Negativicutes bacterium]|nr:hypothetical protein [Negativicutes bacterium]